MDLERLTAERFAREAIRTARAASNNYRPQDGRHRATLALASGRPEDDLQTIEAVASQQSWQVRYRPWIWAAGIAAGFLGMRWLLNRRKTLVENPRGAKDPAMWMLPLDLGEKFVRPEGKEGWVAPAFNVWLMDVANVRHGGVSNHIRDWYHELAEALGSPTYSPAEDDLAHTILQDFAYTVGEDIFLLDEVIAEASRSRRDLENLWFVIYNPHLTFATKEARARIFEYIRKTPKEKRWRIDWLIRNLHDPTGAPTIRFGEGGERDFDAAMALPYEEFIRQFAPNKEEAWREVFDRVPRKQQLKNLIGHRDIVDFNPKAYLRAYNHLTRKVPGGEGPGEGIFRPVMQEADALRGAVALQFIFGNNWKSWLEGMDARGIDEHDATMWLPTQPAPGLGKFLRKHALAFSRGESGRRYTTLGKPLEELTVIAKAWNSLGLEQRALPYKEVLAAATTGTYEIVKSPELAREASRWGIGAGAYGLIEDRWVEADRMQLLPDVSAEREGLRAFLLPKEDPRGLFLGMHTSCCQEPEGAGAACAWWGVERPSSGFYAVENAAGKIVAQSWTWIHGDVLVFDNIEGPAVQASETRRTVIDLFGDLAVKILEADHSLVEVRIGETVDRRATGNIDWGYPKAKDKGFLPLIPPPLEFLTEVDDPYTDASGDQYIMASATDKKSTFFASLKFKNEFAEAVEKILRSSDDEQLEVAAGIIKGVGIPYDIECEFHDDAEVDVITKDITVRCDLDVGGRTIDQWTKCIRVKWADSSFSSVDVQDDPHGHCFADEVSKEYSTDSFMEMLGLDEPEGADFADEWWAMPPEPPEQNRSGNVAVVLDGQEIVARYDDEDEARIAMEMMELVDNYSGYSVYMRMVDPAEDEEHGPYDELYGWEEVL